MCWQGHFGTGLLTGTACLPFAATHPPAVCGYMQVRSVSLTMGAPFLSHMATMADTGLLVGRHGPLLASAVLLPPGAAVLELLPYKWEWQGVSR